MNVRQDKSGLGLPVTRIETISHGKVDATRVGFAGLTEDRCDGWLMMPGDILFSHINSVEHIGKCAIYEGVPEKLVHGMNLLCFRCDETQLAPQFTKHLMRSSSFRKKLNNFINKAVNQASVSIGNLRTIRVNIPPLSEQRRIAAILDKADALRVKRREANESLDRLSRSIFVELFGDIASNSRGWATVELGEVATLIGGYAFKSDDFAEEGNAVIRISNIHDEQIDISRAARIPTDRLGKGKAYNVSRGDILIAMSGATIGKIGVVPWDLNEPLYQNQRVGRYEITAKDKLDREFLISLLRSDFYQRFLRGLAWGAAQPNVSGKQLESAIISLPPLQLQKRYAQHISSVRLLRGRHNCSLLYLNALFASLQHQAFRGEL